MIESIITKNLSATMILIIALVWTIIKLLNKFVFKKNNNPGIDLKIANQKIECTQIFSNKLDETTECVSKKVNTIHGRIDDIYKLLTKKV